MRTFLVFVVPAGLLLAISPLYGGNRHDPVELLAKAIAQARSVEKSRTCSHTTERFDVGKQGRETKVEEVRGERDEIAEMLTLEFLFKPGRFQLSLESNGLSYNGRAVDLLSFFPQPEKHQLKTLPSASRKGRAINWGMNRMGGIIRLDRETGGIIRIKGSATPNQKASKYLAFSAELYTLEFLHEQKLVGNTWEPEKTEATLHFTAALVGKKVAGQHSRYVTRYHCQ